jgi:hypothetical protein
MTAGKRGNERLAFDKASVRTIDTDGRMHVEGIGSPNR